MKILFLLTQDLESPGGGGRYFPWARELAQLGHTVTIAALHANFAELKERQFVQQGVQVAYVAPMHVLKRANRKIYYSLPRLAVLVARATLALTTYALSHPADIIQIGKPHPMNSLAGMAAHLLRRTPLFVDCDDYEVASGRFSGTWQQKAVAYFENHVPRWADRVTTHTSFIRQHLLSLGLPAEKITYLPNGVDTARFADIVDQDVEALRTRLSLRGRKVVSFIGSLSAPSHPVGLLLKAFSQVKEAVPEAALLVVGGGEEYDRLSSQATQMGIARDTVFCGRIPFADTPAYYRLADVMVDPVFDDEAGRSRLPLKLFESWVSGVPFVTGDVGDRKLVLGAPPAGVIVEPGSSEALAKGILSIFQDVPLAESLRQRGFEQAQAYSWPSLAKKIEAVYLEARP